MDVRKQDLVCTSWVRAVRSLHILSNVFHSHLAKSDKAAAKLFAGATRVMAARDSCVIQVRLIDNHMVILLQMLSKKKIQGKRSLA